jgi:hypothetical protein
VKLLFAEFFEIFGEFVGRYRVMEFARKPVRELMNDFEAVLLE